MSATEVEIEVTQDPAHYVTFDLTGTTKLLCGFSVVVFGYSLRNPSSSVAAAVDLYDTPDGTGTPVIPLTLAASESLGDWFGDRGVWFRNALYANVTAGEVKGSVFFRHHRR